MSAINTPPTLFDLAPDNSATLIATAVQASMGFISSMVLFESVPLSIAISSAAVSGAWLYGRYTSKELRGGKLFYAPAQKNARIDGVDNEVTEFLNKRGIETVVIKKRTYQNTVYVIPNYSPKQIEKVIPDLSMLLNLQTEEMTFIRNYGKGQSAIMTPLDEKLWEAVPYQDGLADTKGLKVFLGMTARKKKVINDHEYSAHVLIAGMSGSGKTQLLKVMLRGYMTHPLKPEINLFNPKKDLRHLDGRVKWYSQDPERTLARLEILASKMDVRQDEFSKHGHDNFFDMIKAGHKVKPIIIILDEFNELVRHDKKRAMEVLWRLSEMARSAGMFLIAATQKPKAESMPTELRDNFGARAVLRVADKVAAGLVKAPGAEMLPFNGGMMFQTVKKPGWELCRSAFIDNSFKDAA